MTESLGPYRIVRRIATGGTSEVLLARAQGPFGFTRLVVLKRLLSQHRADASFARMLAREATAFARIDHPAVVRLYDFFEVDRSLVLVLEYVEGITLDKLVEGLVGFGGHLDDAAVLYVGARLFAAIAAAHAATDGETGEALPIVHCDINPSNVLVPWSGHVKVTDFGIAKVAGMPDESQRGRIRGTYGYMAPEQASGEAASTRSDVFSGALVLWEMFARRRARNLDSLRDHEAIRVASDSLVPSLDVLRSDLPLALRKALMRAVARDPRERTITADEVLAVLRATLQAGEGRMRLLQALDRMRPARIHDGETAKHDREELLGKAIEVPNTERQPQTVVPQTSPLVPRPGAFGANISFVSTSPMHPSLAVTSPPPEPEEESRPSIAAAERIGGAIDAVLGERDVPDFRASQPLILGGEEPNDSFGIFAAAPEAPGPALLVPAGSPPSFGRTMPVGAMSGALPTSHSSAPPGPSVGTPAPPYATNGGPQHVPPPGAGGHPPSSPPIPIAPPPAPIGQGVPPKPGATSAKTQTVKAQGGGSGLALGLGLMGILVLGGGAIGGYFAFLRPSVAVPEVVSTAAPVVPSASSTSVPAIVDSTSSAPASSVSAAPSASSAPSALAAPSSSAAPASSGVGDVELGPKEGRIRTAGAAPGRRVFVDDRVSGETPNPIVVACGSHRVRIGSSGKTQTVDVPCGHDVSVSDH